MSDVSGVPNIYLSPKARRWIVDLLEREHNRLVDFCANRYGNEMPGDDERADAANDAGYVLALIKKLRE